MVRDKVALKLETRKTGNQNRKTSKKRRRDLVAREMRHLQKVAKLVIPCAPFIRLVKSITETISCEVDRWCAEALVALQEAAEDFIVHQFSRAYLCAIHARRVTLLRKDMQLANRIAGRRF